jgi:hypothetical protein
MKLLGIISVGSVITDLLLIRFSTFARYWSKNGSTMEQCISYLQTSRKLMTQLRQVLCNILLEFGIPKKLVRLSKMCLNETYGKVHIGKHLSDKFPIQNGLKQGDALSPFLFNFDLKYAIRKVQENQVCLESNQ